MIKPFPYQKEDIESITKFKGRALCALEMGLGKTLISLWWLKQKKKERSPCLVVCPAGLKYMWEHEAKIHLGVKVDVLEGRKPPKHPPRKSIEFVVINYDVLSYWLEWLKKIKFRTLVIEECHYIKNRSAKRTKAVKTISKGIPNVLGLSGTPLTNRPSEMFSILNILFPKEYTSFWKYAHRYCNAKRGYWGWEYDGATHLDELHTNLKKTGMIRRLKVDVLKDLPPKTRRVLPVPLSNPDAYKQASNDFLSWLKKNDPKKVQSAKRALAITQLGYLKRMAAKLKLRGICDWVNAWLEDTPNEKLVLFAIHRKMIEALERRIECKSVVIHGGIASKDRQKAVQQFQEDPNTRLFIGNVDAAGVGYTLTGSSTLAFTELDWVPAKHNQCEDRIHRIGQNQVAWIYYLIAGGTIEEHLCKIIQKKQEILSTVLDGGASTNELDIHKQLMSMYLEQVH